MSIAKIQVNFISKPLFLLLMFFLLLDIIFDPFFR